MCIKHPLNMLNFIVSEVLEQFVNGLGIWDNILIGNFIEFVGGINSKFAIAIDVNPGDAIAIGVNQQVKKGIKLRLIISLHAKRPPRLKDNFGALQNIIAHPTGSRITLGAPIEIRIINDSGIDGTSY